MIKMLDLRRLSSLSCLFLVLVSSSSFAHGEDAEQVTMRVQDALVAALPVASNAVNVVLSNDDGWAVSNIRAFQHALMDAGFDSIVSAPAENQSGRGSLDADPEEVVHGCQFRSCPPGSPATGSNASDPRLNYVNSYPVTAMSYGIDSLAPDFFGTGKPDIALAGPNHGSNLGPTTLISGTVGAAVEAASRGIPAIAFSGRTGKAVPWYKPTPATSKLYAELAVNVTQTLTSQPGPYLPNNTWLNVNFPHHGEGCRKPSDVKFVLSRISSSVPLVTPPDVETCGNGGRLPWELTVVRGMEEGCFVSVSLGRLDKFDADKEEQEVVLERLESILSCLG